MVLSDAERARILGSPLRIGQFILPLKYGAGEDDYEFRADPFLQMIEENVMDAVADRKHRRFQKYNAPPQVTKSTMLEVLTPLWALTFWPNTRVIIIAYSDDIAIRSGSLIRDIIDEYGAEYFGLAIDPRYDTKQEWRLLGHMGGVLSVGIGSRITGMPGDLIIIGDVIKNMEEAASPTVVGKHWTEYEGSIRSRLQKGGTMLLGATKFSDQDLSGHIDALMADPDYKGDQWESFVFKAIAEPRFDEEVDPNDDTWRDILGRRRGEPLLSRHSEPDIDEKNPEDWEKHHFYAMKNSLSPFTFSCIHQQEPTSPTGGMFPPEKWNWYNPLETPRMVAKRRVWDLAASKGTGDWTAGGLVGKDAEDNVYILDMNRFQKDPNEVLDEVELTAALDGVATPIMVEGSRNGDGKAVVAFYAKRLSRYTVEPANADGSKETRARPYSTLQQKSRVFLPRYEDGSKPEWVAAFIDEHRKMMGDGRKGRHDDQIDVCAHAINAMLDSSIVEMLVPQIAMHDGGRLAVIDQDDDDSEQLVKSFV